MNCGVDVADIAVVILFTCWKLWGDGLSVIDVDDVILILILKLTLGDPLLSELVDDVALEVTLGDSLILKVAVGKTEELIAVDEVGDKDMDSVEDEDLDFDSDDDSDLVREVVMDTLREGEAEAIALIDGVEAAVAERERLWLWLNVEDVDPDVVAIEDMVMDLLADVETLSDEEGVVLEDVDSETLELGLDDVVSDTLVLWDTVLVGEILELDDVVPDRLVLCEPLELEEAVADILVLCETLELRLEEVVAVILVLWDSAVVTLGLDDDVGDMLEVELLDIDIDGELEIAGPAPTATNAIFDDWYQYAVVGSVSPTV